LRHGRAPNYLTPAVPAAYGFAAAGLVSVAGSGPSRWSRLAKYIGAAVICFAFLWSLVAQAKGSTSVILAEPDPGILLGRIQSAGYGICYANYWDAYKLQFLSGEEIRFIPYKSRSRNRDESLAAELAPGEKCLLLPDGTFRRYLPSDRPKPLPLWGNRPASALDLDRSRSIEPRT
jgi:hypothetical protein